MRSTIEVLLGALLSVLTARIVQVALPNVKLLPLDGTVIETPCLLSAETKLPKAFVSYDLTGHYAVPTEA